MKKSDQEEIERIFHTALELSGKERIAYLEDECAENRELFEEVESLLKSFEDNRSFLAEPVFEMGLEAISAIKKSTLSGSEITFYKVQEKIGEGGMGEVYSAVDKRLNRRVALKFLSDSLANNYVAKQQLRREAQAAAALEHQNICAVHGIEETPEHHFIVMQFIEGITLAEYLKRKGKISLEEFNSFSKQILDAISFAHSHDIIHRDLKPGNIMLTDDGKIKILDFGLAKIVVQRKFFENPPDDKSLFSSGNALIGTVSYMSPELLRGKKADYRSDVFSLGVIFYELLTGKNPFTRPSKAETMSAILTENAAPLEKIEPDLPPKICAFVEKCLEKDPEKRYQSAAEILVEFDNAKSDVIPKNKFKRRNLVLFGFALAAAILLVIFAGLFLYNRENPQRTLAILPITIEQNLSDKEYLADGLTRSIIEKLSNLSELKVKNQYIIENFKGKIIEPKDAGRELNADAVVVGTIKKRDSELFITSKIVRTSDGSVIGFYESPFVESSLIELTENLCSRILEKVKSRLTEEDKNKIRKKDTENFEAKLFYIRGQYHLTRQEGEDLKTAENYFKEAIRFDPVYAKAWAGLADTYSFFSVPGHKGAIPPDEAIKLAKAAANQAIEIDDSLCEPYNSLGMIKLRYEWDWSGAETYFRESIKRCPDFPMARLGLSSLLLIKKEFPSAIEEAQKAKMITPFSILPDLSLVRTHYFERNYEQMDRVLNESLKNFPNHKRLNYFRGLQFVQLGRLNEAVEIFERIHREDKIFGAAPLGLVYGKLGRREDSKRILNDLEELSKIDGGDFISSQEKAYIYLGLGEIDKVFELLDKACKEKFSAFPFIINEPLFDEIKEDKRYNDLKKCANFSD